MSLRDGCYSFGVDEQCISIGPDWGIHHGTPHFTGHPISQSTTWSSSVGQATSTCQALATGTKVNRTNTVPTFMEHNFSRGDKQETCNDKLN